MKFKRSSKASATRSRLALALAALLVISGCGGGDSESSNRQRNTALTVCASTTLGEPTVSDLPTGGYEVVVTVALCDEASSFSLVAADGTLVPVNISEDKTGNFDSTTSSDGSANVTIRLFNGDTVIGDEVISLSVREDENPCELGGPCKAGDVGPSGGVIVDSGDASKPLLEVPKLTAAEAGKLFKFPECTTTEEEIGKALTESGYGDGRSATDVMKSLCGESNELLTALTDFNSLQAVKGWFIPSITELVLALDSCCDQPFPDTVEFASSSLLTQCGPQACNTEVAARGAYWPATPGPVWGNKEVHFIPVRYVERKSGLQAQASVAPVTSGDAGTATPEPGTTLADTSTNPINDKCGGDLQDQVSTQTLPSAENLEVSYDESAIRGTLRINFDYPTASWDGIDQVLMSVWGASNTSGVNIDANVGVKVVDTSAITSTASGTRRTFSVSNRSWASSNARLRVCVGLIRDREGDSGRATSDFVSTEITVPELPPVVELSEDARPRAPKNLVITSETQGMLKMTWSPDRPAVDNSYTWRAASYPYRYLVLSRQTSTDGSETPWARTYIVDDSTIETSSLIYSEGVSYDFLVKEIYDPDQDGYGEHSQNEAFVSMVPNPGGDNPPPDEGQLTNEEIVAKLKECEKIPTDIRFTDVSDVLIEPPFTTDNGVHIIVKHQCVADLPIMSQVTLAENDPATKSRLWMQQSDLTSESSAHRAWFPAFAPGEHNIIAQVTWEFDGVDYRTPFASTTMTVTQGMRQLPTLCTPDKMTLVGSVLSSTCEGVELMFVEIHNPKGGSLHWEVTGNEADLGNLPAGWLKSWIYIKQWSSPYHERFVMLLCASECENTTFEKEFNVLIDGDKVTASVTQNDCPGWPYAELEEFFRVTDNVYYSFNRYFSVDEPELDDNGKKLTFTLQPATAGLLTERDDYCDVLSGSRKYSFMQLDRTPAPLPDPATAPKTEEKATELSAGDVSAASTVTVPAGTSTVSVGLGSFRQIVDAMGGDVLAVSARVDGGNWQVIAPGESNDIKLSKNSKKITFRGTKADGKTVEIEKVVEFNDEKTVKVEPVTSSPSESSSTVVGTGSSSSEGESSSMNTILIAVIAALIVVLLAVVLNNRRKKPTE